MTDTIVFKNSNTPGNVPTSGDLELGELALNTADGKLFFKKEDDSIVEIGSV